MLRTSADGTYEGMGISLPYIESGVSDSSSLWSRSSVMLTGGAEASNDSEGYATLGTKVAACGLSPARRGRSGGVAPRIDVADDDPGVPFELLRPDGVAGLVGQSLSELDEVDDVANCKVC